jgi:hypothetical protein
MTTATIEMGLPGITIKSGDHICAFYRGSAQRDELLVPYLREGLLAGDKCICVMDDPDTDRVVADLAVQVDVDLSLSSGQFDLLRSDATYLSAGYFETDEMLAFWESGVGGAVNGGGFDFVRAVGEMTWALRDLPGVAQLVAYEGKLNAFLPRYPQVILCLYDLEQFSDGQVLINLLRTHPKVLLGGQVLENPWYVEPDEYLQGQP